MFLYTQIPVPIVFRGGGVVIGLDTVFCERLALAWLLVDECLHANHEK